VDPTSRLTVQSPKSSPLLGGAQAANLDVNIGRRIRARRMILGMSQEELGDAIGVTQQQIKNYERAATKVTASRLYELASILDVPLEWFYRDSRTPAETDQGASLAGGVKSAHEGEDAQGAEVPMMAQDGRSDKDALLLLRAFRRIKSAEDRRTALNLLKRFGTPDEQE
jgi:transcriptional regulator with XRE-family HTH domain